MEDKIFLEQSKFRSVEESSIVAFYNPRHDVNRFFAKGDEEDDDDNSLDLDDDLNVFKNEGTDSDLIEQNKDKILYYVDLENEEIIDADKRESSKEDCDDCEEEVDSSVHPVLFNQFPLGKDHNILLMFATAGLPQVLSDEILDLLFQIFRLFPDRHLRIGYNSMGAECWINNLHFHLLSTDNVFSEVEDTKKFPIEDAPLVKILDSTLQHKSEDEINMYSVGVEFYITEEWPVKAFVVKPLKRDEEESKDEEPKEDNTFGDSPDPTASVAHAVGGILNILIDSNTPHNLLISDQGETVYVIPRKFDLLINAANFSTEFNDLCGLVKCKDEKTFENLADSQYKKFLKKEVSLDTEAFTKIKDELITKFVKEYECTEY
ncbi:unnamed protein product [Moneuplotes crassus]|uniref:GDP-D-glucose phosphorylase 1 n=1 Tax=Euplotes crassus TaxID=5936 RepID=A0AAD1XHV9_EUPCR|nr:unnamed protein product [Moneuplotes crassus]